MAAVGAVRSSTSDENKTRGHPLIGHQSARGVAGEAKVQAEPRNSNLVSAGSQDRASSSPGKNRASSKGSYEQLRSEVQALLSNVQNMGARLAEVERECSEKAKVAQDLQKAFEMELAQVEAAHSEVRNARQRIEAFKSILSKNNRDRGTEAVAGTLSPNSQRRRDDEVLGKLCVAGAEAERRVLKAELAKVRERMTLNAETSACQEATDVSPEELRARLAARQAENADLRQQVARLRADRQTRKASPNAGDSVAECRGDQGRHDRTSTISAEEVEEIVNADWTMQHKKSVMLRGLADAAVSSVAVFPAVGAGLALSAAAVAEQGNGPTAATGLAAAALSAAEAGSSDVVGFVQAATDAALAALQESVVHEKSEFSIERDVVLNIAM
jgi:hypothetical protein